MRYRLAGEYRRFQAVMGIDEANLPTPSLGDVHVVISGDGKPLFEGDVRGADEPIMIGGPSGRGPRGRSSQSRAL